MNIYIPTEAECEKRRNPNYIPPSIDELMEGIDISVQKVFSGESNGNYGNPTNYKHGFDQIKKITENNTRHWKGKKVPWKGCSRPDNYDRMHLLWEARRGKPSWNKGLETGPQSEESKKKKSEVLKGRPQQKYKCPHCGKNGGNTMFRWHFDNCKMRNDNDQDRNY